MKNKKWWKVLLPVVGLCSLFAVVFVFSSAKTTSATSAEQVEEKHSRFEAVEIPSELTFAGETVPVDRFYVKEALDRELLSNAYFHSQTIRYIKYAPRYFPIIEPILKEEGIHEDFKYLAVAESGFNPRAISSARAAGFWQFMKPTAGDFGLEVNGEVDERYHIEKSTRAACKYLKQSYKKFGSWTLVAASYNRGVTGIYRQMERQKEDEYYDLLITTETARYVYRILALKLILQNPEKYNFYISEDEKYPVIPTREVEIKGSVANFADFAHEQGISYKMLKDFNPWLRDTKLTYSGKKQYFVKIPEL